ncbi:MAG: ubiquinol-cytochrome c reductase iron-sulfur subunit [Candidatus Dormibacteraeota bacterium]|nr:ubiquinol-cytochrome c reductase iron-sulfur subunit [Candidatus Dormibacteraeota bacterium]MBV9525834.1 ubiquinol-cytochrome c reductase iron-sulfur subunit [Candidatus Dormibacteraeota bacterium]
MRDVSRRQFLIRMTGLGAGAIGVMLSIPALGFLLSPLFAQKRIAWLTVGAIDQVPVGTPTVRYVDMPNEQGWPVPSERRVVYIVRKSDGTTRVLSNICSHMQCDVHWEPRLGQFLCPCHGGLYDIDGVNIGGPPPAPLPQWVHRITLDPVTGQHVLEVQNQLDERV